MLAKVVLHDRYKSWVDAVAELYGGLDICAVEAIQGKDGKEYITEVRRLTLPCIFLLCESISSDWSSFSIGVKLLVVEFKCVCYFSGQ